METNILKDVDFKFNSRAPTREIKLISKNLILTRNISLRRFDLQSQKLDSDEDRRIRLELMSPKIKKYLEEEKKYNGKLVYVGQLTRQLKSAKILSLTSSLLGLMLMPFLTDTLSTSSLFAQIFVFGTSGFFIFVTPLFSQFLGRRYVSRMYYNYEEKKFKAILFSFFMYEYKLEFGLNDIYVPDIPGPFSTVRLRKENRNLFIDLHSIQDADLIQHIYGYDKPFDLKKFTEKENDD